ncbi:hypothetical protein ACHAQA_007568 [Verticillium albo-atrum]
MPHRQLPAADDLEDARLRAQAAEAEAVVARFEAAAAEAEAAAEAALEAERLRVEADRTSPPPPNRLSFAMERWLQQTPNDEPWNPFLPQYPREPQYPCCRRGGGRGGRRGGWHGGWHGGYRNGGGWRGAGGFGF